MKTIGEVLRSEPEASSRASDDAAQGSVSDRARARELHRLKQMADRIRGELAELKDGSYNPREHPSRRAKLAALLSNTEESLFNLKQRRLI